MLSASRRDGSETERAKGVKVLSTGGVSFIKELEFVLLLKKKGSNRK
jgi:hypothetical protein